MTYSTQPGCLQQCEAFMMRVSSPKSKTSGLYWKMMASHCLNGIGTAWYQTTMVNRKLREDEAVLISALI